MLNHLFKNVKKFANFLGNILKRRKAEMKSIFERIANSLESIATEIKASRAAREELKQQLDYIESTLHELKANPFGIKEKE